MVPEARLKQTEAGLVSRGPGWFVLNAREAAWNLKDGRGQSVNLTGADDDEAEAHFHEVGVNLFRLGPGEPLGMYHWEADQEDFLVLTGEALLLVEGGERPLRQWDFVHCPAGTQHIVVGAGHGPCLLLAVGARAHIDETCNGGAYTVADVALRHAAGVEEETSDADVAYARFPKTVPTRYRDGWLP